LDDEEDRFLKINSSIVDKMAAKDHQESGMPVDHDDMEFLEHRYLGQYNSDATDPRLNDTTFREDYWERDWNPYHQDMSRYPEIYKMYGENYERYEKVKARFENEDKNEQMEEPAIIPRKPKDQSPWEKRLDDNFYKYRGDKFN
jgi:hypothetical protein